MLCVVSCYAADVNALLVHLEIDKAIIGGESMGGYVTLAFMDNYPEKVSGLILSNTQAVADSAEHKQKRIAAANNVMTNGPQSLENGFIKIATSPNASEKTKSDVNTIVGSQSSTGVSSALLGMANRPDLSSLLTSMKVPLLNLEQIV